MGERIIYLVRHGQMSKGEPLDKFGNGLTALGRRQARWVARRLSTLPISAIHHSPLRRAVETAGIIRESLPQRPIYSSPLLSECIPGWPIHVRQYLPTISRDEIERDRQRAERALRKFFRPVRGADRQEVLVAHGNLIRYLVLSVLGMPPKLWSHSDIHNCGLSEVHILPDGVMMLMALNDTGHIPRKWLTYL